MRAVQRHTESPESGAPSAETAPVQRRASPRGHDYATAVQRLAPVQLREDRASVQGKSAEDLNGGPTFGGVGKPT